MNIQMKIKKIFKKLHLRTKIALGIIAVLLPIVIAAAILPQFGKAEWFNDAWEYRQLVPVTNSSGSAKSDFQVKITLDTAALVTAGKVQSDCDDLRITDSNGKLLPHWVEPNTCNTTETLIWTKVPSISTSGADLYVYYGAPSASSVSATEDVFIREMASAAAAWPMQEEASTTLPYTEAKHPSDDEGRDIVINGGFDEDSDWGKGGSITISGGVANFSGSAATLYQTIPVTQGKSYRVYYTIASRAGGTLYLSTSGFTGSIALSTDVGDHYVDVTADSGTSIYFVPQTGNEFDGTLDNVSVKQVDIPDSGDFDGTELLTDGDMEAADTSAWSASNNATLSKETSDPQEGSQNLKIAYSDTANPRATQTILTVGSTYHVTGYSRSDGSLAPSIVDGDSGTTVWTGDTSTSWQTIDIRFTAKTTRLDLKTGGSSGYTEWDDVSVTEISPLSGEIPTNSSGNRPTLGADSSSGHLSNAYTFDGTDDYVDIYSTDLNSVFNPDEGTLIAWAKVSGSGVWTDGEYRWIVNLYADADNRYRIYKHIDNNRLNFNLSAGGDNAVVYDDSVTNTDWIMVAMTWNKSADEMKAFINGSQTGATQTGLGTWVGNLDSTKSTIGAGSTTPTYPWSGDINDVRLYPRALSADEISDLYNASEDREAYYTDNYEGYELIRKYDDPSISLGTFGDEEIGPGAVAIWHFDEGTDNSCPGGEDVCDATENGNDGTFTGNPEWQSEDMCISGKCLEFDGSSDLIAVGTTGVSATKGTVTTWAKNTNTETTKNYIYTHYSSGNRIYLYKDTDNILKVGLGSSATINTGWTFDTNTWHNFTLTWDSGNYYVYVDGQEQASGAYSGLSSITSTAYVGSWNGGTQYWQGFIDEVKVYPYARSADQVQTDYLAGVASAGSGAVLGASDTSFLSDGLVGYWDMDEASGTTVADSSGNGNDGTLTNAQETGTSDATSSTTTLVDTDGSLSSTDDAYNGMVLSVPAATCAGLSSDEERIISDYTGSTNTITVATAFSGDLDSCTYTILHQVGGKFGNGMEFDGENDYVDVGNVDELKIGTNDFTISGWLKPDTADNWDTIVGQGNPYSTDGSGYDLEYRGDQSGDDIYLRVNNGSGSNQTIIAQDIGDMSGSWHHFVATIDQDNKVKIYLDGVEQVSEDFTQSGNIQGTTSFKIGAMASGTANTDSNIDEVRVYNRALSPAEVSALYNWAPGPVGHWNFDENSGTTAFDRSGNGNDGTLTNSPTWSNGKYGGALDFDGTNDVNISESDELDLNSTITVMAWVRRDNTGDHDAIFSKRNTFSAASPGYGLTLDSSGPARVEVSDGTTEYDFYSTKNIDSNWHHITAIIDKNIASNNKIYVDGVMDLDTGSNWGSVTGGIYSNAISERVGLVQDDTFRMDGLIDDVKIYNYARTPAQILQDMKTTSSSVLGATSGGVPEPIAHWKFDEGQGQIAFDSANEYAEGPELLSDGDMEAADTSAFYAGNNATLSKQTTNPHAGSQLLRVAYSDSATPYAYIPLTTGIRYRVTGYARGDGTNAPSVFGSSSVLWTGTSSTSWQKFDFQYTNSETRIRLRADTSSSGYAEFDDVSVKEITSTGNPGTLGARGDAGTDDPTWTASGKRGGALSFDGGDYVSIPDEDSLSFGDGSTDKPFSLSAWVYMNDATSFRIINKTDSSGSASWEYHLSTDPSDKLIFYLYDGGTNSANQLNFISTDTVTNYQNQWIHVTAAYDGLGNENSIEMYINGQEISGTSTKGASYVAMANGSISVEIGRLKYGPSYANGKIDEVKIYNFALTPEQVKADMNAGSSVVLGNNEEAADLSDGAGDPPIAEWLFDEKSGTVVRDISGNGNDGDITGASWTSGCKQGACLSFDGNDDVVNVYSSSLNSNFNGSEGTVEVWIKPNASAWSDNTEENILRIGANSSNRIRLMINGINELAWNYAAGGTNESYSKSGLSGSEWIHMSMTWSSTDDEVKYYYNGSLQETDTGLGVYAGSLASTINIIGNEGSTGTAGWLGQIDQVRVYDYARTPAQIAYDHNRGKPIAHYRFDECEGSTIHDASGNGNDGTLTVTTTGGNTAGVGTCQTSDSAWGNGASGKYSSSVSFDGDGDYVDIYSSDFNSTFNGDHGTISLWAKVSGSDVWNDDTVRRLIYLQVDSDNLFVFQKLGDNNIELRREAGTVRSGETITITDTGWVMYTLTWDSDSDEVKVYINGSQQGTTDNSLGTWSGNLSSSTTVIGAGSTSGSNVWDGQIDEVQIYNYALSASQVKKLYNQNSAIRFE